MPNNWEYVWAYRNKSRMKISQQSSQFYFRIHWTMHVYYKTQIRSEIDQFHQPSGRARWIWESCFFSAFGELRCGDNTMAFMLKITTRFYFSIVWLPVPHILNSADSTLHHPAKIGKLAHRLCFHLLEQKQWKLMMDNVDEHWLHWWIAAASDWMWKFSGNGRSQPS